MKIVSKTIVYETFIRELNKFNCSLMAVNELERNLFERLKEAMELGDASSHVAGEVAELHKRWLSFYWTKYTKEAHLGLAQMYNYDERFTAYYDQNVAKGATEFLVAAIEHYTR